MVCQVSERTGDKTKLIEYKRTLHLDYSAFLCILRASLDDIVGYSKGSLWDN